MTSKWVENTCAGLRNVEAGIEGARGIPDIGGGLRVLQNLVDEARELLHAGDLDGVKAVKRQINRLLDQFVPLTLAREEDRS